MGVVEGQYLVAQVDLLSGVYLYVAANATVLGSVSPHDYRWNASLSWEENWTVIRAYGVHHVGLLGEGSIDGQAMKVHGYSCGAWGGSSN